MMKALLAGAAFLAMVAQANAQDGFNWTGAYVGAHAGYGWGSTHDVSNPAAPSKDLDGIFGGLRVGYNHQFSNNVVIGVEADAWLGSVSNDWRDSSQYSGYFTEDKVTAGASLRARLGYSIDRFLPFVTGGVTIAKTDNTLGCDPALVRANAGSCLSNPARAFKTSKSDTTVGYVVGGGAEYAITGNWTLSAEYLYTDLGKNKVVLIDPGYVAQTINARHFDTKFSTIRLGVNYKF